MNIRKLVRKLIYEEIGRNYRTIGNEPYSYLDDSRFNVNIYADATGNKYLAQIEVPDYPEYSTKLLTFSSHSDAEFFVKRQVEIITSQINNQQ